MSDMQSRLSKMIVQLKYLFLCDFILSTSCTSKEEILLIVKSALLPTLYFAIH